MGKLILPMASPMERGRVLLGRVPGGVGSTIRCVERDPVEPVLLGFRPVDPVRGTAIGWVIAALAEIGVAGIKPVGCGGLIGGKVAVTGGV